MDIPPMPTRSKIIGIMAIIFFSGMIVRAIINHHQAKAKEAEQQKLFMSLPEPKFDYQKNRRDLLQEAARLSGGVAITADSKSDVPTDNDNRDNLSGFKE